MARDGYGMPVPDGGSPLPWSANEIATTGTPGALTAKPDGKLVGIFDGRIRR